MPRRCRRLWLAVVLGLGLLGPMLAARPGRAGLEEGQQAYQAGKYPEAFQEFLAAAQAGDLAAQNQVAAMYYIGQGIPQDFEKAAEWFQKAADGGSLEAQYCLGKLYYHGQGVSQDFTLAAKWLTDAAVGGKGGAQYLLGVLYLYGKGVSKNPVKAYFWSLLAASSANIAADDKAAAIALREQIKTILTPKQIDSIRTMARDWAPYRKKNG